jgi:hypothetical protein
MSLVAGSRAQVGEQVDLRVDVPGELVLPQEILDRLHLEPGDLVALEPGAHSVRLDLYREALASFSEDRDDESTRQLVEDLLDQPLTAVLAGGRLPIPEDVLPLAVGDRCVLQIVARGLVHEIFLFRVTADG